MDKSSSSMYIIFSPFYNHSNDNRRDKALFEGQQCYTGQSLDKGYGI